MNRLLLIALFLFGLALLFFLCAKPKIPAVVANCTNTKLTDSGLGWAKATVKNRGITLAGEAESHEQITMVHQLVSECEGDLVAITDEIRIKTLAPVVVVETVEPDQSEQPVALSPYVLTAIKDEEQNLTLNGYLPSEDSHASILSQVSLHYPDSAITDQLKMIPGAPGGWTDTVLTGIEGLNKLSSGRLEMVDLEVSLSGNAASATIVNTIKTDSFSEKYTGIYQLTAPDPLAGNVIAIHAPEVAADHCQKEFNALLLDEMIHFETSKAVLTADSEVLLQALSWAADKCPNVKVTINGHTDNIGNENDNQRLSENRAKAVIAYLVSRGVSEARLTAMGYGEAHPIGNNETNDGREMNRRIEFIVEDQ